LRTYNFKALICQDIFAFILLDLIISTNHPESIKVCYDMLASAATVNIIQISNSEAIL
jgi:hypothetical protein